MPGATAEAVTDTVGVGVGVVLDSGSTFGHNAGAPGWPHRAAVLDRERDLEGCAVTEGEGVGEGVRTSSGRWQGAD